MIKTSAIIEYTMYQTVIPDSNFNGIIGYKSRSKIATILDRNMSSSIYSSDAASTISSLNKLLSISYLFILIWTSNYWYVIKL